CLLIYFVNCQENRAANHLSKSVCHTTSLKNRALVWQKPDTQASATLNPKRVSGGLQAGTETLDQPLTISHLWLICIRYRLQAQSYFAIRQKRMFG
ncbi:MAG: hypothetical protein KDE56_26625, partial [Anaerolineales bacterium]|nr:hypothetical protein [Anaerolineales bacterium]